MAKPLATIQRESVELVTLNVSVDDEAITDFQVCIVLQGQRPITWTDATVIGSDSGALVSGLAQGLYSVFVKVSDDPETPVLFAGTLEIQ